VASLKQNLISERGLAKSFCNPSEKGQFLRGHDDIRGIRESMLVGSQIEMKKPQDPELVSPVKGKRNALRAQMISSNARHSGIIAPNQLDNLHSSLVLPDTIKSGSKKDSVKNNQ